jgi:hypothetical protein
LAVQAGRDRTAIQSISNPVAAIVGRLGSNAPVAGGTDAAAVVTMGPLGDAI